MWIIKLNSAKMRMNNMLMLIIFFIILSLLQHPLLLGRYLVFCFPWMLLGMQYGTFINFKGTSNINLHVTNMQNYMLFLWCQSICSYSNWKLFSSKILKKYVLFFMQSLFWGAPNSFSNFLKSCLDCFWVISS